MTELPLSKTYTTRERYRADIENALSVFVIDNRMGAHETFDPPLALEDGEAPVPVVTVKALEEGLRNLFRDELPPPDERQGEFRTPSFVTVWAKCPNCGIHMVIPLSITPQLVLDGGSGELKLKTKSKGRIHACNQLTLDEPTVAAGQVAAFAPDALDGQGDDVEDVSEPAEPEPEPKPKGKKGG